jgi:hypothetical protein
VLGTYLDGQGGFDLRLVPAGTVTFWLDRPQPAAAEGGSRLFLGTFNITGDTTGLILGPVLPARLTGKVVWEGPARREPVEIHLYRKDSDRGRQFTVAPPGYIFDLNDMAPGEYGFRTSDHTSYIREIRIGDETLLDGRLRLEPGERRDVLIVAGVAFARVSGRVNRVEEDTSGSPVPAAHYDVLLDRANSPMIVQSDQFGVFAAEQVIPGEHTICAFRERPAIDWNSGRNCEPAGEFARKVTLDAGSIVEIDVSAR